MLTRIPGIGRKTAERVIIEMRDSVQKLAAPAAVGGSVPGGAAAPSPQGEAFAALLALGYKPPEAARLLKAADAARTVHDGNDPPGAEVRGQGMRILA